MYLVSPKRSKYLVKHLSSCNQDFDVNVGRIDYFKTIAVQK